MEPRLRATVSLDITQRVIWQPTEVNAPALTPAR